jgi:hypothetical protein
MCVVPGHGADYGLVGSGTGGAADTRRTHRTQLEASAQPPKDDRLLKFGISVDARRKTILSSNFGFEYGG